MSYCASKLNGEMLVMPEDMAPYAPAVFSHYNIYGDLISMNA